ncbi:hypothetical protein BJ170DRAFT_685428 [Xylariales sp. AK1849]|nr:hypothetical protein BJ170DRAFT_685428 [Xylariales sp. AK1849]
MDANFDQKLKALEAAHKQGIVVGLKEVAGVAPRLDIDVLIKENPKAFNLFLIAFELLKQDPRSDIMGFFQIAGIHGFPNEPWFKIDGRQGVAGDPGYCAHRKPTFPTWHRPYLAMLEQALFIKMMNYANSYNEPYRTQYREAVFAFRLPFWDYHRPRGGEVEFPGIILGGKKTTYKYNFCVPLIFTVPTVTIFEQPNNTPRTLKSNPLQYHAFDERSGQLDEESEWKKIHERETGLDRGRTSRHPLPDSLDNPGRLNSIVNELRMDSARLAVTLVTHPDYGNYEIISQTPVRGDRFEKPPTAPSESRKIEEAMSWARGSLEGIHNMYHVYLGGFGGMSGHVGFVPVAAFDPLFWFHHNNIERMFTVWQAVHAEEKDCWFNYDPKEAQEPLRPFLARAKSAGDDPKDFWNSDSVRDSRTLGYHYRETGEAARDLPGAQIAQNYKNQYLWSIPLRPGQGVQDPPETMKPIDVAKTPFFQGLPEPVAPAANTSISFMSLAPAIGIDEAHEVQALELAPAPVADMPVAWDWYIDDEVEAMILNQAFTIPYFVVANPSVSIGSPQDFVTTPTLVGATHIFTAPIEACGNCASNARDRTIVRNTMFITSQLIDYIKVGSLESLDPEHVVPFLSKRLRWRVVTATGTQVDPRHLTDQGSLKVGISSRRTVDGDESTAQYAEYPRVVTDIIAAASAQATFVQQG